MGNCIIIKTAVRKLKVVPSNAANFLGAASINFLSLISRKPAVWIEINFRGLPFPVVKDRIAKSAESSSIIR